MFDDMTIRFLDGIEFGFNVWGGISTGVGDGINLRQIKTYKVLAAKNEAFLIHS